MNEHDTPITESIVEFGATERFVRPAELTGKLRGKLFPQYFTKYGATRANKMIPSMLAVAPETLTGKERHALWPDVYTTSGKERLPPEQIKAMKAATCAKMRARKAALRATGKAKPTKVGKRVTKRTPRRLTRPLPDGTTALQNAHRDVHEAAVRVLNADLALDAATQRAQHDLRAVGDYLRGLAERVHKWSFDDDMYYAIHYWAKYADDCAANFRSNAVELMNEELNDEQDDASEAS